MKPSEDVLSGAYVPFARPTRTCPAVGTVVVPVPPSAGVTGAMSANVVPVRLKPEPFVYVVFA